MSTTSPPPSSGGPEYLEPDGGEPVGSGSRGGGGGRRTALVAGGAAVALAAVGGGVWAAMSFFATGSQPAEGLPASTIGYASVDLDPSGGQKIEAFRMMEKFPALKEELELDGFDADDDLLEKLFQDVEESCKDVSYADDMKPWLGYRFGVAAVDLGEELPTPVGVVQVTDASAAEDGLAKLQECAGADVGGWAIDGEWAVIGETEEIAQQVVDATADGTLADDEDFQRWTDEVGEAGVLNLYAAPEAGQYLAEFLARPMNPLGGLGAMTGELPLDEDMEPPATEELPEEVSRALEAFEGMAGTLRFDDGALEFEVAGGSGAEQLAAFSSDQAADAVTTLPEDTAAAFGIALPEGWLTKALAQAEAYSNGEMTADDMIAELEAQTGLTVEELETLTGESAALALGSELDPETFFSSSDGSDVPVGAKIQGDTDAIQGVLQKLADHVGEDVGVLGNEAEGGFVAVGPNPDYRQRILGDGGLGDSEVFQNVVREADDASAILYVNFDAGSWLDKLAESDPTAAENLEPLQGIGFSSWVTDDAGHAVFRLTTD